MEYRSKYKLVDEIDEDDYDITQSDSLLILRRILWILSETCVSIFNELTLEFNEIKEGDCDGNHNNNCAEPSKKNR
jgi:hypothetical protein